MGIEPPINPHQTEILRRFREAKNIAVCKHCGDTILWAVAGVKPDGKRQWRAFNPRDGELHNKDCKPKIRRWKYK